MTKSEQNTNIAAPPLRYCLYARKSSEDDEKQALSINSQIREMKELAKRYNLEISEIRQESHSAKDSGQRSIFNELIEDITIGQFNAILTWAPDRLSRNAGDLGSLVDLMDQGLLQEIKTPGQTFTNSPNEKFLLMILCSQAKLENDNKGVNVKRGMKAKCEMGHRPCMPPIGYMAADLNNKKGQKRTIIDPERAPVIKQMFEKVAYEMWSGRQIYRWLNDELKMTTRNNKKIYLSTIYKMLENTFYYGEFEYPRNSGNWFKGDYEPIITKDLFVKARDNIVAPKQIKRGSKEFFFTRMITCGHCGCTISAEEKFKNISDGTIRRYVYYFCSGRGMPGKNCKEQPIREEDLMLEMEKMIDKINLNKKDAFTNLKRDLEKYNKFAEMVIGSGQMDLPKRIDIKAYAKYVLKEGTREEKRELLLGLKSKLVLKDKKISIKQLDKII